MPCKTIPEDLSVATKKEPDNTSIFPYAESSTLYGCTLAQLRSALGVAGQLKTTGASAAVPILSNPATGLYYIAGIEAGNGVSVTTSPQGGVKISASITNAAVTGAKVVKENKSELRRIVAGNGISIIEDTDTIEIGSADEGVSGNTVIVTEIDDLPGAVSGVITLADNTDYLFAADVSTSNRFILGANTVVRAVDPRAVTLTYTGAGTMFTTANGSQTIKEITISCANGQFIDTSGNTTGNTLIRWVLFSQVKDLGDISKPVIGIYNLFIAQHTGAGFTYGTVTGRRLTIETITVQSTTNATLDFVDLGTATFNALSISGIAFISTVTGQNFIKGAAASANISAGVVASIRDISIAGDMTTLDTIASGDARFNFNSVDGVPDTRPDALLSFTTPTTTTIASAGVAVIINGTWTQERQSQFTTTTGGRATYNGELPAILPITARVTAEPVSGGAVQIGVYLAKNGTVIANSEAYGSASSGNPTSITMVWQDEVNTGDYYEVFIENDSSSVDLSVAKAVLRVN